MPRRQGKKKKGKVIRPGMEQAMKKAVDDKLKGMGLGGLMQTTLDATAAQSAAESNS